MNDGFTFPLTVESTSFPSENYCIHCLGPLQYAAIFSIALQKESIVLIWEIEDSVEGYASNTK